MVRTLGELVTEGRALDALPSKPISLEEDDLPLTKLHASAVARVVEKRGSPEEELSALVEFASRALHKRRSRWSARQLATAERDRGEGWPA